MLNDIQVTLSLCLIYFAYLTEVAAALQWMISNIKLRYWEFEYTTRSMVYLCGKIFMSFDEYSRKERELMKRFSRR